MSQHGGSSMMSSENPEVKYKKALKEISKLINANKVIREESEEVRRTMENQMNEFAIRYNDLQKDYHELKKEHESLQKYLEELQESNSELQRQHHTAEKELAYLNEMLAEQNAELKKVQAIKDEKKITQLIRTYQEKEQLYTIERNSHEELIKKLREEQTRLEFEIAQQRSIREQTEDKFDLMRSEINQYREINAILIQRNEKAYNDSYNKEGLTREKEKEIQGLVQQFRKQISSLKTAKQSVSEHVTARYENDYGNLLQEKNRILSEYVQLKEQYETAQNKIRDMYEVEQKMKSSQARAEALQEQCNMLKSKIVVLESREVMDEGVDFEFNKQFDDKIHHLIAQGDPLIGIKNSDETSHFKILKNYIIQLREKLQKVHAQRKEYTKKYKSVSQKFTKLVEETSSYEEQTKMLRGKVEGFEKLTEKLQTELERNMMINEAQVNKMSIDYKEMLSAKNEEIQTSMRFMREQIEQIHERSTKTEKNLVQEIESTKLELSTLVIRNEELTEKLAQSNEFIGVYKKKLGDLTVLHQEVEDKNGELSENLIKFQQLYKDEKAKAENLATQKADLSSRIEQVNEELDRKVVHYEEQIRVKSDHGELEVKKYRLENGKLLDDIESLKREVFTLKRDSDEKKNRDSKQIDQLKKELSYFRDLESQHNFEKQKNRDLQTQNETLRIKNTKYSSEHEKASQLQDQLTRKTDEFNDQKRKLINMESALNVAESDLRDQKIQTEILRKENATLRMSLLEKGQQIRRQFDSKDQDSRQAMLRLSDEISELHMQLNEERSKNSRINSEYHRYKAEKQRLEQFCDDLRDKESRSGETVSSLNSRIQQLIQEIEKGKAQNRMLQLSVKRLNDQIDNMQTIYHTLRQEHYSLKSKEQDTENSKNEIVRELESTKFYFADVEEFVKRTKMQTDMSWEDQRARDNMNEILIKIKKLIKSGDHADSRSSEIGSSSYHINIGGTTAYEPTSYTSATNVLTTQNTRKTYTSDSMMLGESSAGNYHISGASGQYTSKEFFTTYADSKAYGNI